MNRQQKIQEALGSARVMSRIRRRIGRSEELPSAVSGLTRIFVLRVHTVFLFHGAVFNLVS
jgi:hypothetical protein